MLSLLCILIIAWSSTRARRSKVHWIISFHLNFYFIHHNRTLYMQMTSFVEWLPAPLSARDGGWSVEGPMNGFRSSGGNLCFCRPKIKKNLSRSGFCSEPRVIFIGVISRSLFEWNEKLEEECECLELKKKSLTSDFFGEEKKLYSDCRYSSFPHSLMSPSWLSMTL